jgi:hypothetical protein
MEHRWDETDSEKPKYSRKHLSQRYFVHNNSHMDLSRIEHGPRRWKAGDWKPEQCHDPSSWLSSVFDYLKGRDYLPA